MKNHKSCIALPVLFLGMWNLISLWKGLKLLVSGKYLDLIGIKEKELIKPCCSRRGSWEQHKMHWGWSVTWHRADNLCAGQGFSQCETGMLYTFFWVIPRHLNSTCWHFETLRLFHFHRLVGSSDLPAYKDGTERVFQNVGI
jgi:hypothetical protein